MNSSFVSVLLMTGIAIAFSACDKSEGSSHAIVSPIARSTSPTNFVIESSANGTALPVYFALPVDISAPVKTVLVLHGSGGPWNDEDTDGDGIADLCHVGELSAQSIAWRDLLTEHGYAAVFVDSYSPRGTCENEGAYKDPPLKFEISGTFIRNRDAYDVLAKLKKLVWDDTQQPVVDKTNVAILGFSDGGTSVISTLFDNSSVPAHWVWKQSFSGTTYTSEILPPVNVPVDGGFKVGVLYYPGSYHNGYYGKLCDGEGIYRSYCDVLFHMADLDPLSANTECLINTMEMNGGGIPTVFRYEGADHGFDGTDEPYSSDARERTIAFLDSKMM